VYVDAGAVARGDILEGHASIQKLEI